MLGLAWKIGERDSSKRQRLSGRVFCRAVTFEGEDSGKRRRCGIKRQHPFKRRSVCVCVCVCVGFDDLGDHPLNVRGGRSGRKTDGCKQIGCFEEVTRDRDVELKKLA